MVLALQEYVTLENSGVQKHLIHAKEKKPSKGKGTWTQACKDFRLLPQQACVVALESLAEDTPLLIQVL